MMRFLLITLIPLITLIGCGDSKKGPNKSKANSKIKFETTTFDFGKIPFGSDGTCVFAFSNDSKNPLVINIVRTSCGCTNPEWPKDPIETGIRGEIKVSYNTQIVGSFQKSITVFSNAVNSPVKLIIKGEVQAAPTNNQP